MKEEGNESQILLRDLTRLLDHDIDLSQGRHLGRSRDHSQDQDQGEAPVLDLTYNQNT